MQNYSLYNAPKLSLLEARINNILHTRQKPFVLGGVNGSHLSVRPLFSQFDASYTMAVALKVGTSFWYITFQEDTWLRMHPSFNGVLDEKHCPIPTELKQALLKFFIEPYALQLGSFLGINVEVTGCYVNLSDEIIKDLRNDLTQNYGRFPLSCSLGNNQNSHSQNILTDIFLPKDLAIDSILEALAKFPLQHDAHWSDSIVQNIPVEICFEAGFAKLSEQDYLNLEIDDIILPDEYYTQKQEGSQVKLYLGNGDFSHSAKVETASSSAQFDKQVFSFCSLEGSKATLLHNITTNSLIIALQQKNEDTSMSQIDNDAHLENTDASQEIPAADKQEVIQNFETIVSFELERRVLNIGDIQAISEGYTFALGCDKDSPVTLRVNGKAIGSGRLVDMEGMLGVQVTKLGV